MYALKVVLPFFLVPTVFWDLNFGGVFLTFPLVFALLFGSETVNQYFLAVSAALVGMVYDAWLFGRIGAMSVGFFLVSYTVLVVLKNFEGATKDVLVYLIWYAVLALVLREIWGVASIGLLVLMRWRRWRRG